MLKRVLASVVAIAAGSFAITVPAYAAAFQTTATNLNIRSDAYLSAGVVKVAVSAVVGVNAAPPRS